MAYASSSRPHPSAILTPPSLDSAHNGYGSPTTTLAVKSEWGDSGQSSAATPDDGPMKKKQKRNKPTLSCHECVERKTKVSSSGVLCQWVPTMSVLSQNWFVFFAHCIFIQTWGRVHSAGPTLKWVRMHRLLHVCTSHELRNHSLCI